MKLFRHLLIIGILLLNAKNLLAQIDSTLFISSNSSVKADFRKISDALLYLDTTSINYNQVTLSLDKGLYIDSLFAQHHNLIIESESGNKNDVEIRILSYFKVRSEYFNIQNITLSSKGTKKSPLVSILHILPSYNKSCRINNCIFKGFGAEYSIQVFSSQGKPGLIITNNEFHNGFNGINIKADLRCDTFNISNNYFYYQEATALQFSRSPEEGIIENNKFYSNPQSASNYTGIELYFFNGTLRNNAIYFNSKSNFTGLSVHNSNCQIVGNYITGNNCNHLVKMDILNFGNSEIDFYNNTIRNNSNSFCGLKLLNCYHTTLKSYNNVFYSTANDYCIFAKNSNLSYSDHNSYFSQRNVFYETIDSNNNHYEISKLEDLKSLLKTDSHSYYTNPYFRNDSLHHINNLMLNNSGLIHNNRTFDLDNDIVNTQMPDIGSDEFTPAKNDLAIYAIEYPATKSICSSSDSIEYSYYVVNASEDTIKTFTLTTYIKNRKEFSHTYSHLLNPGDSFKFVSPIKLNVQNHGIHQYTVEVTTAFDSNSSNNKLNLSFKSLAEIDSFPYRENFEDQQNLTFHTQSGIDAKINLSKRAAFKSQYGLHFQGNEYPNWIPLSGKPTYKNVWTDNYTHHAKAYTCKLNPPNIKHLRLRFDLRQTSGFNTFNSNFRVMLNDSILLKNMDGDSTFNPTSNYEPFKTIYYELSEYLGHPFHLSFESSCWHYDKYIGEGDNVFIDNVVFFVPQKKDVGVSKILEPSKPYCIKYNHPIKLELKNYGSDTIYQIPLKIILISPIDTVEIQKKYIGKLIPNTTDTITVGFLNNQNGGTYTVIALTKLTGDTVCCNNDTAFKEIGFKVPTPIPFIEYFSTDTVYENWILKDVWRTKSGNHGLLSDAMTLYVWDANDNYARMITASKTGPIDSNVYLSFDYRFIENASPFEAGATLLNNEQLKLIVSKNCAQTWDTLHTISIHNHDSAIEMKKVQISLDQYYGENILIGFYYTADDFNLIYLDIDNVTIGKAPTYKIEFDSALCLSSTGIATIITDSTNKIKWYFNNSLISSSSSINTESNSTYYFEVSDSIGTTVYDSIYVAQFPQPIVNAGNDTDYCENEKIALPIQNHHFYTWNDSIINKQYNYPANKTLTHKLNAENKFGCSDSDYVTIFVHNNPAVKIDTSFSKCIENQITIIASGAKKYIWNAKDSTISYDFTIKQQNDIKVLGIDSNGCKGIDSFFFNGIKIPLINIGNDTIICKDSTLAISLNQSYDSVLWFDNTSKSNKTIDSNYFIGNKLLVWLKVWKNGCTNYDEMNIELDSCLISIHEEKDLINIYPNPNNGKFVIEFTSSKLPALQGIHLINSSGKVLINQPLNQKTRQNNSIDFDLTPFSKGIYFIKLIYDTHEYYYKVVYH